VSMIIDSWPMATAFNVIVPEETRRSMQRDCVIPGTMSWPPMGTRPARSPMRTSTVAEPRGRVIAGGPGHFVDVTGEIWQPLSQLGADHSCLRPSASGI
jgi:hypothetical protein